MNIDWTEDKIARIRHLVATGMSASEIAMQWGYSRNSVIGAAHRNGISLRERPKKPRSPTARPTTRIGRLVWQRRLEQKILQETNNKQMNNLVLARARAVGDLAPLEAVELPSERADKPRVKLLHLRDGQCRWPIGHVGDHDFGFCGDPAEKSYCSHHASIAYELPKLSVRRTGTI